MIHLSIIVPFYNVEKYIEQCIRSLYDQDIPQEEYEVICVDDCSPDCSRAIVERLQQEYSTLQLIIHERNKKLGGARNTGLKAAKGEYIWFVDSDDFIIPNCLGRLLKDAEVNDVDMLQFDYQTVVGEMVRSYPVEYNDDKIYTGIDFVVEESHVRWFHRIPMAWLKLHKREFLVENNLWYIEDVMYEDTDLSLYMFMLAKRVKHINMAPYCYRNNPEAITRRKKTTETIIFMLLQLFRCLKSYYSTDSVVYQKLISNHLISQLTQLRQEIKKLTIKEKLEYSKLIRKNEIYGLRKFCNWRTWLAIQYGITCFVKEKSN